MATNSQTTFPNAFSIHENVWIPIKISLKFVPTGPINNNPALVQVTSAITWTNADPVYWRIYMRRWCVGLEWGCGGVGVVGWWGGGGEFSGTWKHKPVFELMKHTIPAVGCLLYLQEKRPRYKRATL